MTQSSLYRQIMGASFGALPPALQQFHSLAGRHVLSGWVEVQRPTTRPARFLAWCVGAPVTAQSGPIRFELQAAYAYEVWTRHFPAKTMQSRLTRAGERIVEHIGPAKLVFALSGGSEKLEMQLEKLYFLGIACPRWLLPSIVAEETGTPGRLHFNARIAVPWVGLLACYSGHLDVPCEERT